MKAKSMIVRIRKVTSEYNSLFHIRDTRGRLRIVTSNPHPKMSQKMEGSSDKYFRADVYPDVSKGKLNRKIVIHEQITHGHGIPWND